MRRSGKGFIHGKKVLEEEEVQNLEVVRMTAHRPQTTLREEAAAEQVTTIPRVVVYLKEFLITIQYRQLRQT